MVGQRPTSQHMKILESVNGIEVKRAFVVADLISAKKDRRKHLTLVPEHVFRRKLKTAKKKALKMPISTLNRIIKNEWAKRLRAYDDYDWYIGTASVDEIGVWKKAGGLPLAWTKGSLAQTAAHVKSALEHDPKILKKRSRYSIPNILKTNVHILQKEKYLFPIIFKGGTGTRGRKGLKRKMKGDIDDGCMRSVALAISGKKTIRAYIGFPRKVQKSKNKRV